MGSKDTQYSKLWILVTPITSYVVFGQFFYATEHQYLHLQIWITIISNCCDCSKDKVIYSKELCQREIDRAGKWFSFEIRVNYVYTPADPFKRQSLNPNLDISGINFFIFLTVSWYYDHFLVEEILKKACFFRNWGKSHIPQQFIFNSALTSGEIMKDSFFP